MTERAAAMLIIALCLIQLQGCAPAVVGGAAATAAVAHDRRTLGTVIEDQNIEFKVLNAVYEQGEIYERSHIDVTSFNGVVLITGQTPTQQMKQRVSELARNVTKVRRVHNELRVATPSAWMARSSDALITAKVKTKLFGIDSEGFDPTRVKVVTSGGTVYLMGLVTRAEGEAATDVARRAGGVQRVVKLFEYI